MVAKAPSPGSPAELRRAIRGNPTSPRGERRSPAPPLSSSPLGEKVPEGRMRGQFYESAAFATLICVPSPPLRGPSPQGEG